MGNLNKSLLLGKIGNDIETRYTQNGKAVLDMSIATNEFYTDSKGQKQKITDWHKVQVWGKLAENCGQYLSKGKEVFVEGKMKTEQYTDKDGVKRFVTKIKAFNVQFTGTNGNNLTFSSESNSDVPF